MKTKIFAAYLPQYHEIPENNEFWGTGFTDWVGVKKAKPLFPGHKQPRIPLNKNYYDLSNADVIRWQAELAKNYGVSGFNIYHYWFKDGHKVLERPAEIILSDKSIDIEFFFSWDNTSWIRSWSNITGNAWAPNFDQKEHVGDARILLELAYGTEKDWEEHFNYLLPFFRDERYLKINGKPVFALMRTSDDDILLRIWKYWNALAIENGLPGVYIITGTRVFRNHRLLDAQFIYQPRYSAWGKKESIETRLTKYLGIKFKGKHGVKYYYDYEKVWKKIIRHTKLTIERQIIPGAVVGFDDTPRRGSQARIIADGNANIFERYFGMLYKLCCEKNTPFMLMTAWNEWGEGAYLEPDEENGYAYLEALKRAVESAGN